jgi:uncharacterized protein
MNIKELDNLKVLELRKFARELKVPKYSRMRKEELIDWIIKLKSGEPAPVSNKATPKKGKTNLTEQVASSKEEGLLDRTEAETRLKMKEAYSSSSAAQKEYFREVPEQKGVPQFAPKARDKFATGELPFEYFKDRIALLVIDPNFFYIYWEATNPKLDQARNVIGWDGKMTVRVYDVTDINFNGYNAHSSVDIEVYERIGCWYIRLDKANRDLIVDIGLKNSAGHFYLIARSNHAKLPPLHMAPEGPIKWMAVDDLGNYVITDIEEYTEADLILLRKILGDDLFKRFLTGEFRGMLFSTVFKKVPNVKEITLDVPSSAFASSPSSRFLVP